MTRRDAAPGASPGVAPNDSPGGSPGARRERAGRSLAGSTRVRRTFAYRVNHALRGDIQAVRAALGSALEQVSAAPPPNPAREALAWVEDAVARLERRALDIALLTQAESGELELNRQTQRLTWVVKEAIAAWEDRAAMDKITLRADLGACDAARAALDRTLMVRALGALLSNAIRFSPPGAEVTIHGACDGGVARITVRDTGCGFARGDATRVFKPFAVGKREAKGRGNGLGLGLAVARAVIEAHGGRVWVVEDGEPGGAVAVELPLK